MTHTPTPLVIAALLLSAGACTEPAGSRAQAVTVPPTELDVLFVVDNSGSMGEEQTSLVNSFNTLINQLENAPGGMPSVHIGVVSTDLGAGGNPISGCDGNGDDGRFHSAATAAGCTPPSGSFIVDVVADDNSRQRNYSGDLSDTFGCIAQLGIAGCGFEQPLESLRRALGSADGADFLRDDAYLAVVILADEDDCSASDPELFRTDQTDVSDPLGPLSSFRCVEFGVSCDGADVARSPATYADCVPRASSPYLHHPDDYVDYLTALKGGDADKLIVSVIAGDRGPLEVASDDLGNPASEPSCSSAVGVAYGGHRLGHFADQFPNSMFTTICDPDLTGALQSTAMLITDSMDDSDPADPDDPDQITGDSAGCSTGAPSSAGLALIALALVLVRRRRRRC